MNHYAIYLWIRNPQNNKVIKVPHNRNPIEALNIKDLILKINDVSLSHGLEMVGFEVRLVLESGEEITENVGQGGE